MVRLVGARSREGNRRAEHFPHDFPSTHTPTHSRTTRPIHATTTTGPVLDPDELYMSINADTSIKAGVASKRAVTPAEVAFDKSPLERRAKRDSFG